MKKIIIGLAAVALAAAVLAAVLFGLFEARMPEQETNAEIFVTVGREGAQSIDWLTTHGSGGVCNADDTPLRKGESLAMDIDIQPGERFTLTACDAENGVLAEAEFVKAKGRMDIALDEDGFSEAAPQ